MPRRRLRWVPARPVPRDTGGRVLAVGPWAPGGGSARGRRAVVCAVPTPPPGDQGRGRLARPPCFLSFPFRSLEFHCHNLIYGCFYLREAARTFCCVGLFSCPLCLRARVRLGEGGPLPFPGDRASGCELTRVSLASGRSAVSFQYLFLCCFYHGINY